MEIADIKKKISPILRRHQIKKAAVFGSYARGEQKKRSDIDILIEYKYDNKSYFDLMNLQNELEKKLKKSVDIITYRSIYHRLRERILKDQKIIL